MEDFIDALNALLPDEQARLEFRRDESGGIHMHWCRTPRDEAAVKQGKKYQTIKRIELHPEQHLSNAMYMMVLDLAKAGIIEDTTRLGPQL